MKHSHYFKPVTGLTHIDVYRVLRLFEVTDPCLQHAIKKLLVAGGLGAKDISQDVQEAVDTLERWKAMRGEDVATACPPCDACGAVFDGPCGLGGGEHCPRTAITGTGVDPVVVANVDAFNAFDEARADIIGQNGNTGEHYEEKEPTRPRHVCSGCGQGHPLHRCTAGNEPDPVPAYSPVQVAEKQELPSTDGLVDPTGKPSWDDAPHWAMWLTQDKDGVWRFWKNKPAISGNVWYARGIYQEFNSGEIVGRWQDRLESAHGRTVT